MPKPWHCFVLFSLFFLSNPGRRDLTAQQPTPPPAEAGAAPSAQTPQEPLKVLTLPVGTRLPLVLESGITTRTAKPGDSVYFQTTFPIAQDNRIVIPMGTFARAEVTEAKRAGHLKGRAELRMRITSLTFSNGYVASFAAIPGTLDMRAKESVDDGGAIKGASGAAKDQSTIGGATAGGLLLGTYGGFVGAIAAGSGRAFSTGVLAGGGAGLLTGLILITVNRGPDVELRPGTSLDAIFDRPLALDAAHLPPSDSGTPPAQPRLTPPNESPRPRPCRFPLFGVPCR